MKRNVTVIALSTLVAGGYGLAAGGPADAAASSESAAVGVTPAVLPATPPAATQLTYRAAADNGIVPNGAGTLSTVAVTGSANYITVNASNGQDNWTITLAPPTGGTLTAGATYTGATRIASATSGGLGLSINSEGCETTSSFQVYELATDGTGAVTSLEVGFEARCGVYNPAYVLIRFNATGDLPAGAPTGHAPSAPTGATAAMAFVRNGDMVLNPGTGTGGTDLGPSSADLHGSAIPTTAAAWTPGANRIVFTDNALLHSFLLDGTGDIALTGQPKDFSGPDRNAAVAPDGTVAYTHGPSIFLTALDGSAAGSGGYQLIPMPNSGASPGRLAWAADGSLLYDSSLTSQSYPYNTTTDVYRYAMGASTLFVANAAQPTVSPDGSRIAFVRADADGVKQIFTVAADGVSGLTQVTHEETDAVAPSWSADGRTLAYSMPAWTEVLEVPAAGGAAVGSVPDADLPSFVPAPKPSHVTRVAGASRLETALAASRHDFADHGVADLGRDQAGAVVLARSDNYADALGGSSLAVRKNAPLLITDPHTLDGEVAGEMQRVLAPGGTVYLLGGTAALTPAVASAVQALHYNVVRLAGGDRYATSVAIAQAVDPSPRTVLIASGDNFPDALAAGATGLPLVLTAGSSMPAATAAYLNFVDPLYDEPGTIVSGTTQLVTIGGPGDSALINGYQAGMMPRWSSQIERIRLVGDTREGTALLVARAFFGGYGQAAFATSSGWPDALSGGAMIGHLGGPLLLTDPGGLFGPDADLLSAEVATGGLQQVDVLGGIGALPPAISQEIAGAMGGSSKVVVDQSRHAPIPAGTRVDEPEVPVTR